MSNDTLEEALQPLGNGEPIEATRRVARVGLPRKLVEELLQLATGLVFLRVEREARTLQAADGAAEAREVDDSLERCSDFLDLVKVFFKLERVVRRVQRKDDGVDQAERD